jgi:hypothetical protein
MKPNRHTPGVCAAEWRNPNGTVRLSKAITVIAVPANGVLRLTFIAYLPNVIQWLPVPTASLNLPI